MVTIAEHITWSGGVYVDHVFNDSCIYSMHYRAWSVGKILCWGICFSMCKLLIPATVQIIAAQTVHHIVAGMCMFDNEENLYVFL